MATVTDLPAQYQPPVKALQKAQKAIIDIVADTTEGATGKQKAEAVARLHYKMQEAVTQIEQYLNADDAKDMEEIMQAEIDKGIIEEAEAAPPA